MVSAPFKVRALFEYSSPHDDDLQFGIGQIITVTNVEDADWYDGEYVNETGEKHDGIFPRNFVEKYEPTAPPRPSRMRTKRDSIAELAANKSAAFAPPPNAPSVYYQEPDSYVDDVAELEASLPPPTPSPPPAQLTPQPTQPRHVESAAEMPLSSRVPPPPTPRAHEVASSPTTTTRKPSASPTKPLSPPSTLDKSVGVSVGGSLRDRIAAFNKQAAPPLTPFKPVGIGASGSDFIKKPFVPPPPSRNAYVPPPREAPASRVYRRDEDPEIKEIQADNLEIAEKVGLTPSKLNDAGADDEPKPTSLKERIALLQKQQLEVAQKYAEATAKKDKARKPSKKGSGSVDQPDEGQEWENSGVLSTAYETGHNASPDESRSPGPPPPLRRKSSPKGVRPEAVRDGNEADMSGAGDTTEGQDDFAEKEDSDEPRSLPPGALSDDRPVSAADHECQPDDGEDAVEDDDVDPELRRRQELRARMAKISGMGMPAMFGLMAMPTAATTAPPPRKPQRDTQPEVEQGDEVEQISTATLHAPPVPTMMALPGMSQSKQQRSQDDVTSSREPREQREVRSPPPPPPPPAVRPPDPDHVQHGAEYGQERERYREQEEEQEGELEGKQGGDDVRLSKVSRSCSRSFEPPLLPAGRPAPPPIPTDSRPRVSSPPPPPQELKASKSGPESDDEWSEQGLDSRLGLIHAEGSRLTQTGPRALSLEIPNSTSSPAMAPAGLTPDEFSPSSPTAGSWKGTQSKRLSRPPPPIPGPGHLPSISSLPPSSSRPPPPPPPTGEPLFRRSSTTGVLTASPTRLSMRNAFDEEVTEYEGDYDTDIASSVLHKEALKSHGRTTSVEDNFQAAPISEAPLLMPAPIPQAKGPPRAVPPPIPAQAIVDRRRSVDVPRTAPPPPPPLAKEKMMATRYDEEEGFDTSQRSPTRSPTKSPTTGSAMGGFVFGSGKAMAGTDEHDHGADQGSNKSAHDWRTPPVGPSLIATRTGGPRPSLEVQRSATISRRSNDTTRQSIDLGFMAEEMDLAVHSGWWRQKGQVPPVLQGRRDVLSETDESVICSQDGTVMVVNREIRVLFLDYSQTVISVRMEPYGKGEAEVTQQHEPPPRALRQDQLEQAYERFGMPIAEAAAGKKDTVVGDGTAMGLVHELLRPYRDALGPVGTRAFGALIYSNMANASMQQNDEIRRGDIISIRNGRFQGKHGAMHAKYTAEVGKPDHVAVVAEWDGTKKKLRAWEQGRESRKVKLESFKLDDLRSGEVKIWRVMPRSWIGWTVPPAG